MKLAVSLVVAAASPAAGLDPAFHISGRHDGTRDEGPVLAYAGSSLRVRFTGTSLKATFADVGSTTARQHVGFIVDDGEERVFAIEKNAVATFEVAVGLPDADHELVIFKLDNPGGGAGGLQFRGLELDPGARLLPANFRPAMRLEFYGDSFTAGAQAGVNRTNNGWNSFANVAARLLDADLHNNGIGGLAVLDDTGFYQATETAPPLRTGLVTTFDKLNPGRWSSGYTPWDFARYTPAVVVFGFGINDHFGLGGFPDPAVWSEAYERVIRTVVDAHGKERTAIVLHPANIRNDAYQHGPALVQRLIAAGYRAHWFTFSFELTEHPDTAEARRMGEEFAAFLREKGLAAAAPGK